MKKLFIAFGALLVSASVSMGAMVTYDVFSDAPSTNLPSGWISNDVNPVNNHGYVASNSLSYAGTTSSDNSFGLGSKTADYTKLFASTTLSTNETIYFSVLIQMNEMVKNFNSGSFRLFDSTDPNGNAIMVGLGTSDYTSNKMGFSLHNRNRNWPHSLSTNTVENYTISNTVHLVVGSYVRGASGNGSGSVNLWIDPAVTATPGDPTLTMASYNEDEDYDTFQILSISSSSFPKAWQLDEFKVGTEWTDVVSASAPTPLAPVASFSADPVSGTVPLDVVFSDTSTGTITERVWDLGDGTIVTTALFSVNHTYSSAGTYSVELVVSGPSGSDTSTQVDLISASLVPPNADFSVVGSASGYVPLPVTFTDASTGTITNRAWDFGDGTFTNTQLTNVTHIYTTAGDYIVELIVSGDAGSDTYTQVDLVAASNLPPGMVIIESDPADSSVGVNASGIPTVYNNAQTVLYAGDDNYAYSKGDACAVVVFELPDLGGGVIAAANLAADIAISNPGATNYPVALDLWGSRYSDSATVLTNDYGFKETGSGTKLQDDIISIPSSAVYDWEVISTDALGDAALVAWLNAQYDDGAVAGDFVFLRYQITDTTTGAFQIASAHKTDPERTVPLLTIMIGGSIPPAPVMSLGASFGSGQDVVNWTTTQGFGYVYSVYYSTDLSIGFLPLQTGLADTVHSLTNTIDASPVFYKVEAQ